MTQTVLQLCWCGARHCCGSSTILGWAGQAVELWVTLDPYLLLLSATEPMICNAVTMNANFYALLSKYHCFDASCVPTGEKSAVSDAGVSLDKLLAVH